MKLCSCDNRKKQDLICFDRGMNVGSRKMGQYSSEVASDLVFSLRKLARICEFGADISNT